jgi:hypothetical protein
MSVSTPQRTLTEPEARLRAVRRGCLLCGSSGRATWKLCGRAFCLCRRCVKLPNAVIVEIAIKRFEDGSGVLFEDPDNATIPVAIAAPGEEVG